MDAALRTLAQAAEEGRDCPPVRLFIASGDLVVGTPGPSSQFLEAMYGPLVGEIGGSLSRRDRREVDTEGAASNLLTVLGQPNESLEQAPASTLTLFNVSLLPSQGDGLAVPALRVPMEAVNAWWIAGGSTIEAPRESGGWSFGGFVGE